MAPPPASDVFDLDELDYELWDGEVVVKGQLGDAGRLADGL